MALHAQGHSDDALALCAEILQTQPQHFNALQLSAVITAQKKDATTALELLDRALQLHPAHVCSLHNRGLVLELLHKFDQALASYEQALAIKPDEAPILCTRGRALQELKRFDEALESFEQALRINPDQPEALYGKANALQELKRFEEALTCWDLVLQTPQTHEQAIFNQGNAWRGLNQHEKALACYDRALVINPESADALCNKGVALQDLGRHQEALQCYIRAGQIRPDYDRAHYNESLCRLFLGDFEHGWEKQETRWGKWRTDKVPGTQAPRRFSQPLWSGPQDKARRLLVWGEQGLGDQLLHLGMVQSLAQQVEQLTLAVDPRLVPLVQRSFATFEVCATDDRLAQEPCDAHMPMADIGQHVIKSSADFPQGRSAYLVADAQRTKQLRQKVGARKPLVCGLSWFSKGNTGESKSMALREFKPLFALDNFEFIDLQYGETSAERQALQQECAVQVMRVPEVDISNDLDGLAALICACDVVVTISNTTAHLAGALGKPVYVMLPFFNGVHWYWHHNRQDSPWYPSARLFRQGKDTGWPQVIEQVAQTLKHKFKK